MTRFEQLYRNHFSFVWAAAHHCGAPPAVVDDVVQDVFITAHRRLDELDDEASVRGWLYSVTRRVVFRYRRSAARTARRNHAVGLSARRADEPHAKHDAARELQRLLDELGEQQREIWERVELLGMNCPEIAEELTLPVNTVYSRLRLARRHLQHAARDPGQLVVGCETLRRRQRPPRGRAKHIWSMVVASVGPGAAAPAGPPAAAAAASAATPTASTTGITTVTSGLSALAGAGVAVVVALSLRPADPPPTAQADHAPAALRTTTIVSEPSGHPEPSPTPERPVVDAAAPGSPLPPATPPAHGSPAARTNDRAAPARASARPSPSPTPEHPAGDLVEELALLDRAQQQLDAGQVDRALQTLGEHARRFPDGQLVDVRKAEHVRARCLSGEHEAARLEAERLHAEHPTSNVARSTPRRCPGQDGPSPTTRSSPG